MIYYYLVESISAYKHNNYEKRIMKADKFKIKVYENFQVERKE
jgi:hypothetical protein